MATLKYKLLTETAVAPYRADVGDAPFQLTVDSAQCNVNNNEIISLGELIEANQPDGEGNERTLFPNFITYGTGVVIDVPKGFVGIVLPLTPSNEKKISFANALGVIHPGNHREIKIRFQTTAKPTEGSVYQIGAYFCMLTIVPLEVVDLVEDDSIS